MYGHDLITILGRGKAIDVSLVRGSRSNLARMDESELAPQHINDYFLWRSGRRSEERKTWKRPDPRTP